MGKDCLHWIRIRDLYGLMGSEGVCDMTEDSQVQTQEAPVQVQKKPESDFRIPDIPGGLPQILKGTTEKKWPTQTGLIAEEKLVPQLGTDPEHISQTNRFDGLILSNLNPVEVAWTTLASMIPRAYGGQFYEKVVNTYLRGKRSQHGWTSKNIISVTGNLRGIPGPVEIARKPNVLARNIWDRDWKERALEEGKEVVAEK